MFTSLERKKQEQERGKVPLVRVEDAEGPFLYEVSIDETRSFLLDSPDEERRQGGG